MNLPGLKLRPKRYDTPEDNNYNKWGWYAMAVLSVLWLLYNLLDGK